MGGSGGGGSTTTVQKADPWEGQQPYLTGAQGNPIYRTVSGGQPRFNALGIPINGGGRQEIIGYEGGTPGIFPEAARIYQQGNAQGFFPGQTYADFAPETEEALQLRADLGRDNPALNDAVSFNQALINGDFMTGGDQWYSAAGKDIHDLTNAQFAKAGRTNSGYHSGTVAEGLADSRNRFYQQDINNRMQAAGMAPGLTAAQFGNLDQLGNVGLQRQLQDQRGIDEARARHEYDIDNQWENLANYTAAVQGNFGGTTTSEQPYFQNQGAGLLGGAATGAGLASTLGFGGPVGLGIGAIGGGLLGGFF